MEMNSRFKRISVFPIISIADIVLLLLVFFLLTSTYIIQPGIQVHLPRTTTKEAVSEEKVIITITKSGAVYLGENPVQISNLPYLLKDDIEKIILIKADRELPIEMAVKVMEMVRRSGASKLVIATTPKLE
ncbi:MAG: biopolymer transporter ExbD [candidate division WOR-3 bacterium]